MRNRKKYSLTRLIQDAGFVLVGILLAVLIAKTEVVHDIVSHFYGFEYIGSFIAGVFFTSVFTIAPAAVILGELSQENSLLIVALCGGFGAMCGDYILFRFMRDRVTEDLEVLFRHPKIKRISKLFLTVLPRFLWPFLGALVIASPLPDELGIALMGLSKVDDKIFLPLSFALNVVGIMMVGLAARAVSGT